MITNWPDRVNPPIMTQLLLGALQARKLEPIAVITSGIIDVWFDNQEYAIDDAVFGRLSFDNRTGRFLRGYVIEHRGPKVHFDSGDAAYDYLSKPTGEA